MKKSEFTAVIVRESQLSQAAAADQLDRLVEEILSRVRRGQPAVVPGLGTFVPGQDAELGSSKPVRRVRKGREKK